MSYSRIAQEIAPSATVKVGTKVKELSMRGIKVIGFGMGEPDFDTPEHIKEAAIKAIRDGFTKYTPTSGMPELKEAICEKLWRDNKLKYSPSQVIVSCGAKQAILNIILVLCDKGDEVLIPSPYWVSYPEQVKMAGATPIFLKTWDENNFNISVELLENAITPKTKLLIMNSPSNPTGTVYSESELRKIVGYAVEKGLYVLSDEIYENIIYDGVKHASPASFGDEFMKKVITVNGFSKSYAMTGWRLGYAAGPKEVIEAATKIQDHVSSNANSIAQKAGLAALKGDQGSVAKMVEEFDKRRRYIVGRLNAIPDICCLTPRGAFYAFPNVSALYNRSIAGTIPKNPSHLVDLLLEKARIAFVPGEPFGSDNHIRISYATSMDAIEEGMDKLEKILSA
ncbi:MAG TPA: pyridoxal phosphate-dependent aminotransferase [Candidatus Brocadiia bacterium]|nr:pyridoxal phosphate-dependent aminotransferase [Planctomycetota bacterium]MDO8094258.1 pyridoxal phosphate-dependent aminotransferase [Candidatus Brocadiales bacterium]